MISRRFTIFSAVSLLLFVISVVILIRSFWFVDAAARISDRGRMFTLCANDGVFYVMLSPEYVSSSPPGWHWHSGPKGTLDVGSNSHYSLLGFQFRLYDPLFHQRFIGIPFWFLGASAFIAPCIWYVRRERLRRTTLGLCVACCCDLRGFKGDRCPDCGISIVRQVDKSVSPRAPKVDIKGALRHLRD